MTQLSSVIGSILRDIISAQHEANLYSLALSENYGKDGKVESIIKERMESEWNYFAHRLKIYLTKSEFIAFYYYLCIVCCDFRGLWNQMLRYIKI